MPWDKRAGSMEASVSSSVHQTTANLFHSKKFRREIIPSRLYEILERKQMDSKFAAAFVLPRRANAKSHRRFSMSLMSTVEFSAYNATVRSHESLSQTDYCRSLIW